MLEGAELYREIIEINPPLWFWLGAPISLFGWPGLLIFLGLSATLSIILVQRLYPYGWLAYALIFAFFLTGIFATGQREQFTLISVTPYVLLTAARAEGRHSSLTFAVAVGLWAAVGFALKHYFALVPIALQAWLWLRRRPVSPEFIVVCLFGVIYIGAIFILSPDYFTKIVPLAGEAYRFYDRDFDFFPTSDVVLVGAVATLGFGLSDKRGSLTWAVAIAAATFLAIYVGQLKGFRYHGLPALGLMCLMAFSILSQLDFSGLRNKAAGTILIFVPIYCLIGNVVLPPKSRTAEYICTLPRGTRVLALAVNGGNLWPAVEVCGLKWSSRQMFLWTLVSPKLNWFTRDQILHDLATQPEIVVIDKIPDTISPYQFVLSDPGIRHALRPYRVINDNRRFVALQLQQADPVRSEF